MSNFDNNILKKNIRILMENNDITQSKLCEAIHISQPNLSKALNENENKQFTLEQVYELAEFFNVSIDSLFDRNIGSSAKNMRRNICSFIASSFESRHVKIQKIEISEPVYQLDHDTSSFEYLGSNETRTYPAIYFPSRYDPSTECINTDNFFSETDYVSQCGNFLPDNSRINSFINKYIKIYEIYKRGDLPEDAYRIVLEKYLNDVEEDIPF